MNEDPEPPPPAMLPGARKMSPVGPEVPEHQIAELDLVALRNRLLIDALVITTLVGFGLVWAAGHADSFGWMMLFGIPFTLGYLLAHHSVEGAALSLVLSVLALCLILFGMVTMGAAGLMCGIISCMLFLIPLGIGGIAGRALRKAFPGPKERGRASALLVLAVGAGLPIEAALTPEHEPESIATSAVLDMGIDDAWDSIVFYEDVPLPPPRIASLGLPEPIRTEGVPDHVGAITKCFYRTGRLTKLVTEIREGKLLAFDVIEQVNIEDRSIELLSGSFLFEQTEDGRTRVTLTTTYRPKLDARSAWRPFERRVCRGVHQHVLAGMNLQAPRSSQDRHRVARE